MPRYARRGGEVKGAGAVQGKAVVGEAGDHGGVVEGEGRGGIEGGEIELKHFTEALVVDHSAAEDDGVAAFSGPFGLFDDIVKGRVLEGGGDVSLLLVGEEGGILAASPWASSGRPVQPVISWLTAV